MCALFCSSLTKLRDSSFVYQLSGSSYSLASSPTKQENRRDEIQTDNSNSCDFGNNFDGEGGKPHKTMVL